ncbi:MAG TPA: NfeD family protein [Pyrinomonadaceae bacterium]|jgi:membrane-bound ClpP family serine protease
MLASVVYFLVASAVGAFALGVASVVFLSRRRKSSRCEFALMNREGSVTEALEPEGAVLVGGELWRARSARGERVERGRSNVRVVGARGYLLEVEPLEASEAGQNF